MKNLFQTIKDFFGSIARSLDSKITDENGDKLRMTFKWITLSFFFIVGPTIGIIFGSLATMGPIQDALVLGLFVPFMIILISSGLLWFWFKKFNLKKSS